MAIHPVGEGSPSPQPHWVICAWQAIARADERFSAGRHTYRLFRWLAGLGLLIGTAIGSRGVAAWWDAHAVLIILAGVVIAGPDLASISFAGLKMEMLRETRADVREQRGELREIRTQLAVVQSQMQQTNVHVNVGDKVSAAVAASDVQDAVTSGEKDTSRVPLQNVNWPAVTSRTGAGRVYATSVTPPAPSPAPDDGSTVKG